LFINAGRTVDLTKTYGRKALIKDVLADELKKELGDSSREKKPHR